MSIYREEAIDTLISCLRNSEFPATQLAAAETIVSLQGRFTTSGKPLARPFLLKRAGLEKNYRKLKRMEQLHNNPGDFEDISVSFIFLVSHIAPITCFSFFFFFFFPFCHFD